MKNILSVDLEDWFHAEYVRKRVTNKQFQITQCANRILRMLNEYKVQLTFFVVGEIAEKFPDLIEKVYEQGHEIAFHGFYHKLLWKLDARSFRLEIERFARIIRTISGERCFGFRAPSLSMDNRTLWALDILEEFGYLYDSSVFPMITPLYGVLSAPIFPYHPSRLNIAKEDENRKLLEFPPLVYPFCGLRIPANGGFCLRALPLVFIEKAIKKMNSYRHPAVLLFHPWEVNPNTPRLNLGPFRSFITYYNLGKTEERMRHLLSNFQFVSFRDFIESERLS